MKKTILLILGLWSNANAFLKSDIHAFNYCATHKDSFIAIVWPIAQGKDKQIISLFNKFGSINYQKLLKFNPDQAFFLLNRAHYNASIPDMHEHVRWYFPYHTFEKYARIFVVTFKNAHIATQCKYAIRRLFNLQYRAIHINDTHEETMELAHIFFQ